jgi:hypothetical protein
MMLHHKKVHTLEEYRNARHNTGVALRGEAPPVDPKPTDQHFVTDHLIALGSTTRDILQNSAESATRKLRAAGLPSQTRHVIAIDQSKQTNYNTGIQGDVGGHWHKKHHIIAVNRASINDTTNASLGTTRLLTHEWAHAFHDEMSKPQKAAWKSFYEKHVAKAVSRPGSEEDKADYVGAFNTEYMRHPIVKSFNKQLEARANANNAGARMHQSIHRSSPDWWQGMLDDGHLRTEHTGGVKGVVAQTSHTLHGYTDPADRSTRRAIRKNSYVHVRAVDPNDATDRAHMAKGLFQADEHQHLLAVSPVGKPHHVAIVDRRNLKYNPTDGAPKVGTHLLYDHERTRDLYHAGFVKDAKERLARKGDSMPDHEKWVTQSAIDMKPEDFSYHGYTHLMSDRYKNEVELGGSEHKTAAAYVQHMKKRGAINLSNAVYDTFNKLAPSHPKIEYPGGDHTTMERIKDGILTHLESGVPHASAVVNAVKYNVTARSASTNLIGAHHHNDREAAAGQKRTFSPYGASNDQELFATTVEHMSTVNPTANRFSLPHHQRKLVQAWRSIVHGATSLPERVAEAIGLA